MEFIYPRKCVPRYALGLIYAMPLACLVHLGYTDSDFQSDKDQSKSTSGYVFTLGGGAIAWRSIEQKCIADSTIEAEYVAASEAAKEVVWLRRTITIYCDNSGAEANSKEPRAHKTSKHIERKYHLIREIFKRGDVAVVKITSKDNLADPFMKRLPAKTIDGHMEKMRVRCRPGGAV
ncbi:hypothetical protein C2S52_001268 [Perilla frutescens var. hirtella]|nr:hypothetical protein C2S52_001268 [Perilla frutescens var. hirtella]